MRNLWISPSYQDTDFPHPHSLDTKITLFEDRVIGWKLDIADQLINGSQEKSPIRHSGYATLDIIVNPHLLVPKLKAHLDDYVARLRDVNNTDLRAKFEVRYDFDTRA